MLPSRKDSQNTFKVTVKKVRISFTLKGLQLFLFFILFIYIYFFTVTLKKKKITMDSPEGGGFSLRVLSEEHKIINSHSSKISTRKQCFTQYINT